jgi:modulator of FtsH protease
MEYAYQANAWQSLYTTVAAAAAALIGLLFVGLSLHLRAIIATPEHTARAREMFGGLLSLLVLSVLLLIPGQDRWALGGELLAGGLVLALVGGRLNLQTLGKLAASTRLRWAARLAVFHLGTAGVLVAGISLLVGQLGGLYWLVPTVLIFLTWSLFNAWLLVVPIARQQS